MLRVVPEMTMTFANAIAHCDEALPAGAGPHGSPWRERLDAEWAAVTDEVLSERPSPDLSLVETRRIAPGRALAEACQIERAAAARRAELAELAACYAARLRAADRLHARARAFVVAAAQAEARTLSPVACEHRTGRRGFDDTGLSSVAVRSIL